MSDLGSSAITETHQLSQYPRKCCLFISDLFFSVLRVVEVQEPTEPVMTTDAGGNSISIPAKVFGNSSYEAGECCHSTSFKSLQFSPFH